MATANGATVLFADMAMRAGAGGSGRSTVMRVEEEQKKNYTHHHRQQKHQPQEQQHQQHQRLKRPPRACTARTPLRLAPLAPSIERPSSSRAVLPHQKHDRSSSTADPSAPMVLTPSPPPSQKQRWLLRSMWELASIVHFFNVFRPVLKLKHEFTIEELENALLFPNDLLEDIHIVLLKAIPPISRAPINRETWVAVLCKKIGEWWRWVAEGSFPLAPYHGEELATYKELGPDVRAVILKALCEARLDHDDIRAFIDDVLKQGASLASIRKERLGVDMLGSTYWYENDPIAGQRLYREIRKSDKDKPKVRGRLAPQPLTICHWETLATNVDEFQSIADRLASSRNRLEVAISKRINNDILPDLQEMLKKKERAIKKQQRQALLLDSSLLTGGLDGGLAVGRSKRERKPVTYTFEDYDKSISEAIKITKRPQLSPEPFQAIGRKVPTEVSHPPDREVSLSETQVLNGKPGREVKQEEMKENDGTVSSGSEFLDDGHFRRSRHHRKPQRYSERDFVEGMSDNEDSEDDIEGEAVYDDDYVRNKRRKYMESSDGDEEYRGDEDEEEDEDDDDGDEDDSASIDMDDSDVDEWRHRKPVPKGRTRGKLKMMKEIQEKEVQGLRRSQRATRSHVDYSKYEDSDAGGEEHIGHMESPMHDNFDGSKGALTNSLESQREQYVNEMDDEIHGYPGEGDNLNSGQYEKVAPPDGKPGNKLRRFLDLNVAAPSGGQDDSSYREGSSSVVSDDDSISDVQ